MNRDLIEQITRLVLAQLEESDSKQTSVLTREELSRWNEISASIQGAGSRNSGNGSHHQLQPLSIAEIQRWNEITGQMGVGQRNGTGNTGQVKLHTYN